MLLNRGQSSQIKQYSQPWESTFKIFITLFRNPLKFILIRTNFIAFSLGKVINEVAVISVILINAVIRFIQEVKAGKAIVTVEVEWLPQEIEQRLVKERKRTL